MKLKAPRPEQGRIEHLNIVGCPDHEHQLFAVESVHLGEELIDHGVLDTAASVGAARAGKGVDLIKNNDRRGGLASAVENLSQVLLALANPAAFELRSRDNGDGGPERCGHALGEQSF